MLVIPPLESALLVDAGEIEFSVGEMSMSSEFMSSDAFRLSRMDPPRLLVLLEEGVDSRDL